jgi:signal transduction histidine kinase
MNQGGAPRDVAPVAFEPLLANNGEKKDPTGLGLDLYLTQQIVLAHGGTITAESSEDEWMRFSVELPRDVEAETRCGEVP